jgi:hypothetical protein
MRFQKVSINPEGDGVIVIYRDGMLVTHGDDYHDNIREYLAGFFDGLRYLGAEPEIERWYVSGQHQEAYDLMYSVPDTFDELPRDLMTTEYS